MAIEKLERCISPDTDQIPMAFIKAGGRTICSEIQKLINSIWKKRNCFSSVRSQSFYPFIIRVVNETIVFIEAHLFCQLDTKFYPIFCCLSLVQMQRKLMGIIIVDFEITG
jgi:hypothetical protein